MQAMRYGTLPVVTDAVGGLHDTVVDVDADPGRGTGVTAAQPTSIHLLDRLALGRPRTREPAATRCDAAPWMTADWSARASALAHIEHYERIATS